MPALAGPFPRTVASPPVDPVRPVVAEVTEWLYTAVGPAIRQGDADAGYPVLRLLDGFGVLFQPILDLVGDSPDGETGWSRVFDIERTPDLRWLGQFLGVASADPQDILGHVGWRRGTPDAIRAAVQKALTGARHVEILERVSGQAYRLAVRTYASETPDSSAVRAILDQVVPAGIVVDYKVTQGATYAELTAEFATYADLSERFATYAEMTAYQPAGG